MSRADRIMKGAAIWGSYYRANPHHFARDYLHLDLKLFQKILLVAMNMSTIFIMIAARGIGKSFLSAVFCVIRSILYPGTKICIASGTRGQAINVLEKILLELKPLSPELALEIDAKETKINGTSAQIVFKNRSYIKVVTSADSARSNRANIVVLDEARMIKKHVIDDVLKKFLTYRRMPRYTELSKKERMEEWGKEKSMTIWLSSAYTTDHWFYTKCADTFASMVSGKKQHFICGLPYELSICEGLLDPSVIEDEFVESDFNELRFQMEYEALWWGNTDGAFFDYDSISKNRKIAYPMLSRTTASLLGNSQAVQIPQKRSGELRIISADVALMISKKNRNDATAVFINQMIPTKAGRYMSNIVFADAYEGLRTDDQALVIRKLYDEYGCDYIVLDCQGLGLGVFDCLARDIVDPDTGEVYPALSCCNNEEMAMRCRVPGAEKSIWAIKASAQFNSDCAFLLREAFRSARIRLLTSEFEAEDALGELKGYSSLSPTDKLKLQLPYIHTTLLVDELVKLQHEENGGKVRIYERSGMRKDRYSSLSYNYYVATQLEAKYGRRHMDDSEIQKMYIIRPPTQKGKAVNQTGVRQHKDGWR